MTSSPFSTRLRTAVSRWLGGSAADRPSLRDLTPEDSALWEAVEPYTLTSKEVVADLRAAVRYIAANDIPGAIVECGVWRGGSMMAAALALLEVDDVRELYLLDTFTGMTEPTSHDRDLVGASAGDILANAAPDDPAWARAGVEEVRRNMRRTGYPEAKIHYVEGPVEETLPEGAPDVIALLRLDTDWYESTRHELEHLWPRLARGSVLVIDDYGHWAGARRAVDEYFAGQGIAPYLHRVNRTVRVAVKTV